MCLRYNGVVEETLLGIDEAGNLAEQSPGLHLFIDTSFPSCLGPSTSDEEKG